MENPFTVSFFPKTEKIPCEKIRYSCGFREFSGKKGKIFENLSDFEMKG